jgi:cytochrome c oxidase assembly protein subunit 15
MKPPVWPHRLALVTAALTLPLIFLGGRVTSTGSGMAVPDWPTTFGQNMFFFPWSKWVGPVAIEHTHRLAAAVVGLATILFAGFTFKQERPGVRWLGLVALLLVIGQGVLGGMRVVLYEHGLAPIHGCVAQAFFAFLVACVALTGDPPTPLRAPPRALALMTGLAAYVQVVLGAWYRHTAGATLAPHGFFAAFVLLLVLALARAIKKDPALRRWAILLHAFTGSQILLGIASWQIKATELPSDLKVALVSTHLVFGALTLGAVVGTTVLCFRRVEREPAHEREMQAVTA